MVGAAASAGLHGTWSDSLIGPSGTHLHAPSGSVYVERVPDADKGSNHGDKGKGHGSVGHIEKGHKGPRQPDGPPSRHALLAAGAENVARCGAEHARVADALGQTRRDQAARDQAAEKSRAAESSRK